MKDLNTYKNIYFHGNLKISLIVLVFMFFISSCNQNKIEYNKKKLKNEFVPQKSIKFIFPKIFTGVWRNTYESNTNNFFSFSFNNDSIFFASANDHESIIFNRKYKNYKLFEESTDSCYRIKLVGLNDSTTYEFKIQKIDFSEEPVLTYSFYENGELKREHFTSCNLVLTKQD